MVSALGQNLQDAPDIAGYRPRLQRRAHLAFAELPPLCIRERSAKILGFANDAGIAHPHQLVAHLDRDVLQRPLNDGGGDRIDAGRRRVGLRERRGDVHAASNAIKILPDGSTIAVAPGGTTVVLSFCRMMAGPEKRSATGNSLRWKNAVSNGLSSPPTRNRHRPFRTLAFSST